MTTNSPFREILYSVQDQVATVTLNRPDKLNAWTAVMEDEFERALQGAGADPNVRVILVTGAGRGFCAGADMSLLGKLTKQQPAGAVAPGFPSSAREQYLTRYSWILDIPKPVIAAVNGPAVGLGCVIPLYCDIRIASPQAQFCPIFAKRGLIAEFGIAWMLPHLVGLGNALDMLFTARMVDAEEACRMGLVSELLPEEDFPAHAWDFARKIASTVSPRSTAVIKRQAYASLRQNLQESIAQGFDEMLESLRCEDFQEGVAHFVEKRAPRFTGR
ncbi:MAG: enoyl-CoA hydratase [Acidobacteria bacterium]|nr:enoyl-CoA hydratase [Acidobacteriota bacterium]